MSDLRRLKKNLASELEKASIDFDEILRLAGEIANQDKNNVRFVADAAIIPRLGRELVAKQETALAELVKNAYDADATKVTVELLNADNPNGTLRIQDNGHGMTREQLTHGFMRLASDEKVRSPYSPKFGRLRAGRKGIGRFAADRLGGKLILTTQTRADAFATRVEIDWRSFHQGSLLSTVPNKVTEVEKQRGSGTTIIISSLHEAWSESQIQRVFRYVSGLLQPFRVSEISNRSQGDPGFEVSFVINNTKQKAPGKIIDADSELLKKALSEIEGAIDEVGNVTWSMKSRRLGVTVKNEPIGLDREKPAPLLHARNASLKAYYFNFSPEIYGSGANALRDQLAQHGGIRLYRNGYRVLPYGEPDDDWLQLDATYSKRSTVLAPIANRNFLGGVDIDDQNGDVFEETSSREGLIENEAFRELKLIFSQILINAAQKLAEARFRGGKKPRKPVLPIVEQFERGRRSVQKLRSTVKEFRRAAEDAGRGASAATRDALLQSASQVDEALKLVAEAASERDDLAAEINLLRILASMGLAIAEFTHDFSALAQTMEIDLNKIAKAAGDAPAIAKARDRLLGRFQVTRAYSRYFGEMVSENASRKLEPIELYRFAVDFKDGVEAMLSRPGISLEVERPDDYEIYTVPMHPSEWSAILLNFLTNALKAINRANVSGKILIRTGKSKNDQVFLEFIDNGDGISKQNRARVFDAFFTTTSAPATSEPDTAHALGTGLGLKIVMDIVEAVDGFAEIVDAPEGFKTCVRVSVPAAKPEDLPS